MVTGGSFGMENINVGRVNNFKGAGIEEDIYL